MGDPGVGGIRTSPVSTRHRVADEDRLLQAAAQTPVGAHLHGRHGRRRSEGVACVERGIGSPMRIGSYNGGLARAGSGQASAGMP